MSYTFDQDEYNHPAGCDSGDRREDDSEYETNADDASGNTFINWVAAVTFALLIGGPILLAVFSILMAIYFK